VWIIARGHDNADLPSVPSPVRSDPFSGPSSALSARSAREPPRSTARLPRLTNVRDADVELLLAFDSLTRGMQDADLVRKTGLSGGGDGRERKGLACKVDDRSEAPLEQPAFGAGVSGRGALGARVVSAPIPSPSRTRSTTG
jgi:hypothetical protein